MKISSWIMCLLGLLTFCACVYDVPLVEDALLPIDPALTGTWQFIPDDGTPEKPADRMSILPFSRTEWVVITSPGEDELVFRAYPIQVEGMKLIQLEWLQAEVGQERYHVCRYTLQGESLRVEMLNSLIVGDEISSPAALREALLANRDHPELFDDPGRYRRLED